VSSQFNDGSFGYEILDETGAVSNLRRNEYGDLYDPTGTSTGPAIPSPQPSPPPELPTSDGDISPYGEQNEPFDPGVEEPPQLLNRET
jgi:hypothetical protein